MMRFDPSFVQLGRAVCINHQAQIWAILEVQASSPIRRRRKTALAKDPLALSLQQAITGSILQCKSWDTVYVLWPNLVKTISRWKLTKCHHVLLPKVTTM